MEFDDFEDWRMRLKQAFEDRPDIEITKLSVELGKSRDYITRLIKIGTASPSPSLLIEICDRIGVSPAYIIAGEDASSERDKIVRRILDADESTLRRVSRALDLFEDQ